VRSVKGFTEVFLPAICGHVYIYACYGQSELVSAYVFNMFVSHVVEEFINTVNMAFKML